MWPLVLAVSSTLEDIQRLVLLNFDHLLRIQVSVGQALGLEMLVEEVDAIGVVIVVRAAETLVQPGAPVVVQVPAVQTELSIAAF